MSARATAILSLILLLAAGTASADNVTISVGLGGVFPVGQWTPFELSAFNGAAAATGKVVVRVGTTFEREMTLSEGKASGLIFMNELSPLITVAIGGGKPAALPPGVANRLQGIEGKLPVIVVGADNELERRAAAVFGRRAVFAIRMTSEEFAARDWSSPEWVSAFVLGKMSDEQVARLRKDALFLSRSVIVADNAALAGWMKSLPFESSGGLAVLNPGLVDDLPAPGSPVHPGLYEIFGPPAWPVKSRQEAAIIFVVFVLAVALWTVFERRAPRGRVPLVIIAVAVLCVLLGVPRSSSMESVALVEGPEGSRNAVRTEILAESMLRPDHPQLTLEGGSRPWTPVASHAGQWRGRRFVAAAESLSWDAPAPSRQVFVRRFVEEPPVSAEDCVVTDGLRVWELNVSRVELVGKVAQIDASQLKPPVQFAEYLDSRKAADRREGLDERATQLRAGILSYWHRNHASDRFYLLGWTPPSGYIGVTRAGTLVALRLSADPPGLRDFPR
jgi:hypothetical protein